MSHTIDALLKKLQCQFLCCYPLHCINWQEIPNDITWEQQQMLIENTINHPLNQQYPIKVSYQQNFLKRLLQQLEASVTEIHDIIYESYCTVQRSVAQDATQKYAYKHYLLPAFDTKFTLLESKSFVASGTTGLCSWQASLALTDYLLHNPNRVKGKKVLELGAGTGLCGMILTRCSQPKRVVVTDGSQQCVELMQENILRNFKNVHKTNEGVYEIGEQELGVQQLDWAEVEQPEFKDVINTDLLLAADVVYDDSVFKVLTQAIDVIFRQTESACHMLLAATVRNEYTLNNFLHLLEQFNFGIKEQEVISLEKSHLYWDRSTPVKILEISRKNT